MGAKPEENSSAEVRIGSRAIGLRAERHLTTLVQATDVLVAQAVDVLLGSEGTPADGPASIVVPGTIRYGKTTRRSDA